MRENILLLDKPAGITSAKAVERVKRALGVKKAGHAGTLDPLATGLLIIGLNDGTRKLTEYLKLPKTYEAEILLGRRTTTGDLEGEVIEQVIADRFQVTGKEIRGVLGGMVGTLELPVSPYSALKRGGEPLYKKTRRGEAVERVVRPMEIRSAEFLSIRHSNILENVRMSYSGVLILARFNVGGGTYIRSLAEELGRRLGYPATLANLRRTRVGEFRVEDAHPFSDFASWSQEFSATSLANASRGFS